MLSNHEIIDIVCRMFVEVTLLCQGDVALQRGLKESF
jgi:hypothetical protein